MNLESIALKVGYWLLTVSTIAYLLVVAAVTFYFVASLWFKWLCDGRNVLQLHPELMELRRQRRGAKGGGSRGESEYTDIKYPPKLLANGTVKCPCCGSLNTWNHFQDGWMCETCGGSWKLKLPPSKGVES